MKREHQRNEFAVIRIVERENGMLHELEAARVQKVQDFRVGRTPAFIEVDDRFGFYSNTAKMCLSSRMPRFWSG